jgi:hypothetical protein
MSGDSPGTIPMILSTPFERFSKFPLAVVRPADFVVGFYLVKAACLHIGC